MAWHLARHCRRDLLHHFQHFSCSEITVDRRPDLASPRHWTLCHHSASLGSRTPKQCKGRFAPIQQRG